MDFSPAKLRLTRRSVFRQAALYGGRMPVRPFHTRRVALALGELASYLSTPVDQRRETSLKKAATLAAKIEALLPGKSIDCLEVAESNMKLALISLNQKMRQLDISESDVLSLQCLPAQDKRNVTLRLFYWKW
jgi:translation initiation factor IF-1